MVLNVLVVLYGDVVVGVLDYDYVVDSCFFSCFVDIGF